MKCFWFKVVFGKHPPWLFFYSFSFKKNGFLPNKAYKHKNKNIFFFPCIWPKILKIILALFQKNKIFLHVVKNTKKYCINFTIIL